MYEIILSCGYWQSIDTTTFCLPTSLQSR